jgi:hypothetical protein
MHDILEGVARTTLYKSNNIYSNEGFLFPTKVFCVFHICVMFENFKKISYMKKQSTHFNKGVLSKVV